MDAITLHILARALERTLAGRSVASRILIPVPRRAVVRLAPLRASDAEQGGAARSHDLHIDLDPALPALWVDVHRDHPNPDPLAETMSAWASGRPVVSATSDPPDREIVLRLGPPPAGGRAGSLRIRLFGRTPRLVLADADGAPVLAYPGGVSAETSSGGRLEDRSDLPSFLDPAFPEFARGAIRPLLESVPEPSRAEEAARDLSRTLPGCDRTLAAEIVWRAGRRGIPIVRVLAELRGEHESAAAAPEPGLYLYLRARPGGTAGALCAFRLRHLEAEEGIRHTEAEALSQARRFAHLALKSKAIKMLQSRRRELATGLLASLARLAGKLVEENRREEARGRLRTLAQAILVHAGRIPRGADRIEVPDPMDPRTTLAIPLDPRLAPAENAAAYFRRAGREERARPLREARLALAEALAAHLSAAEALESPRAWRNWLEAGDRIALPDPAPGDPARTAPVVSAGAAPVVSARAALRDLREKWSDLRSRMLVLLETPDAADPLADVIHRILPAAEGRNPGVRSGRHGSGMHPGRRAPAPTRRSSGAGYRRDREEPGAPHPRRFRVSGGWEVLVGRNNRENDLLTHSLARPEDLWFHAQGVGGSHTVLRRAGRKDNPSARAIEEAASIAARYSQARHSTKIPVIYTEKRYVRKPRKAAPGRAACIRMKTILARPADDVTLRAFQEAARKAPDPE